MKKELKEKIIEKLNWAGKESWKRSVSFGEIADQLLTLLSQEREKELFLLHEILEAILLKLFYRFYGQEKGMEYQFHFDHTGLTRIVKDLYQVLKDNNLLVH